MRKSKTSCLKTEEVSGSVWQDCWCLRNLWKLSRRDRHGILERYKSYTTTLTVRRICLRPSEQIILKFLRKKQGTACMRSGGSKNLLEVKEFYSTPYCLAA